MQARITIERRSDHAKRTDIITRKAKGPTADDILAKAKEMLPASPVEGERVTMTVEYLPGDGLPEKGGRK